MLSLLGFGNPDCRYGYILGKSFAEIGLAAVRMDLTVTCYALKYAKEYNTTSA
jgi:hypothetical protein